MLAKNSRRADKLASLNPSYYSNNIVVVVAKFFLCLQSSFKTSLRLNTGTLGLALATPTA